MTAERISATVARIMTKVMVSGIGMASEIRASERETETETGIKAEKGEATGTVIKMQNSADISTSTGIATDIALVPPPAHPPRARGKLQPCFCLASHSQGKLQLVRFVQSRCVCVDPPLSFKSQQILANSAQKRNEAKNEGVERVSLAEGHEWPMASVVCGTIKSVERCGSGLSGRQQQKACLIRIAV